MSPIVDRLYRVALKLAYRAVLCWWFVARRPHFGAVTAVWHEGRLLLVRDSYRGLWSMPGGGIGRGEAPEAAAARELAEETGVVVAPGALRLAGIFENVWEYRPDTVRVFETTLVARPALLLDNREIVEARWVTREEAQSLALLPHVNDYLRHGQTG